MAEHIITYLFLGTLCNNDHNPVIKQSCEDSCKVEAGHHAKCLEKACEHRILLKQKWIYIIVYQPLYEKDEPACATALMSMQITTTTR